ncbi:uncharacterized mitochondrial protein-like protein [Tanacetum coccineum]
MVTVRAMLAIAINNNWYIAQLDVNNAFLNGDLTEKRKYALELIQSAGLLNVKPSNIPFNPLTKLKPEDRDLIKDPSTYRAIVGKLLYLIITRSDISYAAQALSQFSQAPRTTHLKALVKALRYIKNRPAKDSIPKENSLQLKAFCDSD